MSDSTYWLNRIGRASQVTTPTGMVPEYGLAADIGTANWPDAQTFNTWANDAVQQERAEELAAAEAEKEQADEQGWFQKNIIGGLTQLVGSDRAWLNAIPIVGTYVGYGADPETTTEEERLERGAERMEAFAEAPGIKQINQVYEATTRPIETGFLMYRNAEMRRRVGGFFDTSEWGAAWREAEDRTLGEAFADAIFTEEGDTNADLDRRRRTNSLYGLTSFASELYAGFKLDPLVLGSKGVGEAGRIRRGELPRGYTSQKTQAVARQAARAEDPKSFRYEGLDPRGHYGALRGRQVASNFNALRAAARTMDYTEFSNLPMFRRKATNGPQAALAFQIAAKDDRLWDLTRRAVMADPEAWAQINDLKVGLTDELNALSGTDASNFVDAIEATKTKMSQLQDEITDLEKTIRIREETGPTSPAKGRPGHGINQGFFEYHSWELHRDLEGKIQDLTKIDEALKRNDDYTTWLSKIKDDGVWATVDQVSTRNMPDRLNFLSTKTYQKSPFGKVHTVSEITKAGWLKTAQPIDLHRVDSGTQTIRRQFEQFAHFFGYVDREAVDSTLTRFVKAKDPLERWKIAQEVEDIHLPQAVAQYHGLQPETVDAFLRQTRIRRNEMAEKLLSGDGAIYNTVPGTDEVKLLSVDNGIAEIELIENGQRHTLRVPEESLRAKAAFAKAGRDLPVDVTQTPNYYEPMDVRQVHLAIKRNAELFELIDGDIKNGLRGAAGKTMETVDQFGTAFNRFWKPLQLFRLAWPQRVLVDEWFRSMAVLGVTEWGRQFFPAIRAASLNAINPSLHGVGPFLNFLKRRRMKIGPGPLADEVTGRAFSSVHEEALEAAPFVPSSLAPRVNPRRRAALEQVIGANGELRAYRIRRAALIRDGQDLPDRAYEQAINKRLTEFERRMEASDSLAQTFDPTTGRTVRNGYAVPVVAPKRLRANPGELETGGVRGLERHHDLNDYIEANADLLSSPGFRLTFRNVGGEVEAQVVRVFSKAESDKALNLAHQVDVDEFWDIGNGYMGYRRELTQAKPDPRMEQLNDLRARLVQRRNKPGYENDPVYQALVGREQRLAAELDPEAVQVLDDITTTPQELLENPGRFGLSFPKKREYGKGYTTWKSADGKDVRVQEIFEGEGEVYVPLISAAPAFRRLSDAYKRTLSKYRQKAVGYKRISPPDVTPEALKTRGGRQAAVDYYGEWTDLLNDQIRNSPVIYKMLQGESDEAIVRWLTTSEEGARIRRQLPHKARQPELWVEELRDRLNYYLPDADMQALLRDRKLQPTDLHRIDSKHLPEIYGPDLEMAIGDKGWGRALNDLNERIYHALGTVPTDLLSRQPLAKAMYDLKMRNLIRSSKDEWLTPEVLKDYEKLSREFAIRQIRRTLFDLTDESNFTQAVRFMAPFWGAQQEAIIKWMGIAVDNPETVARFYVGLDQVYNNFLVIDENGEPITAEQRGPNYRPNDRVIIQIPERMKKVPFFEETLKHFGSVGVSFSSANTALQGDQPFFPSLGPIVTVPAQELADRMWDTHGAHMDDEWFYRWLFPVGRPSAGFAGVLEQTFPGWGRRALAVQQGQESSMYMNTWFTIQREMTRENTEKGLPPPSPEEVERATKWHFALRLFASFGMPAAMEFRPENQFFLDEYHRMQRDFGPGQAFEKFVQQYGADAARYAASSSSGLVPPTRKGMEEWQANKQLVQQISGMGPEFEDLASAVLSPNAWADEFSSDSYREQFSIPVGPGSNKKLRESQDPIERMNQTDRRVGWVQYRQFMSAINAELYNRGLTSLEQRGAEDLQEMKRAWVAEQEAKNPAWSTDYRSYSDTIYQRVGVLSSFAFEPRFDNRPDIQGLRQYLMIRHAAAQSLDTWYAQGGSRSLQAEENTELRNWFYSQVGELVQANPAFGEFYVRFLESDRLERGSGP